MLTRLKAPVDIDPNKVRINKLFIVFFFLLFFLTKLFIYKLKNYSMLLQESNGPTLTKVKTTFPNLFYFFSSLTVHKDCLSLTKFLSFFFSQISAIHSMRPSKSIMYLSCVYKEMYVVTVAYH